MEAIPPRRRHATQEEWDAVRETITRLYKEENKTLKEVMALMAREFNFFGTSVLCQSYSTTTSY